MARLSEISKEAFVKSIETLQPALVAEIKKENATKIIEAVYDEFQTRAIQTATSYAVARMKKARTDLTATEKTGIIIGAREIRGKAKPGPNQYGFFTGRKGIELGAWQGVVDIGDKKIRVPTNSFAKVMIKKDEFNGRESWQVTNVLKKTTKTINEIIKQLVAWNAIIELEDVPKLVKKINPPPVLAMKMRIVGCNAMQNYTTKLKQDVYLVTDREGKQVEGINLSLRSEKTETEDGDSLMAWVRISAPFAGTGITTVNIEDLPELCKEAVEKFENAEDQAAYVAPALEQREILVIGSIGSIKSDDVYGITINVNALALFEGDIASASPVLVGQQPIVKEDDKPVEDAPEDEAQATPAPVPAPETKKEPAVEEKPVEDAPDNDEEEVVGMITEQPPAQPVAIKTPPKLEIKKPVIVDKPKPAKKQPPAQPVAVKVSEKLTPPETIPEAPMEEVTENEDDDLTLEPDTEIEEQPEAEPVDQTKMEEIKKRLLFVAGRTRGVKKDAGLTAHKKALSELNVNDLYEKLGLNAYSRVLVEQAYEDLVSSIE